MDKIIEKLNAQHSEINMKYSTMKEYLASVKNKDIEWPTYDADLFPHLTDMSEYWSGFYTTDPQFKRRVNDYV
jgi:hypothetical protein